MGAVTPDRTTARRRFQRRSPSPRARSAAAYHRGRDRLRPSHGRRRRARAGGLAALTPTGRARVPLGWALYDFANTIFSYAVVSYAIGLWLVGRPGSARRDGQFAFSVAIAVSVGLNAIVSPILGALSDRAGGRRLPYLLFFTLLVHRPDGVDRPEPARSSGLLLFAIANFAYQAALIYYDATLPDRQPARDARHAVAGSASRSATAGRSSSGS